MLNIKITEGYSFTSEDLRNYQKVNETEQRFPHIYKFKEQGIEKKIVKIEDINIPSYMDQIVRDGNNPAKQAIEKDINARGFCLDGLTLVLTPNKEGKYDIIDGVTKLSILKSKDVKNAPVTIINNISVSDRYKLGIKLNHKDKPFGEASLDDIKKVVKELHKIGDVKANGKSLEQSINDTILEMAGDKIPDGKLRNLTKEISENLTKTKKLITLNPPEAKKRLIELGCKSDKHVVYVPVASYIEKTLSTAVKAYDKHVINNKNVEIRLCVYVGDVDPTKPIEHWNKDCRDYPEQYNKLLKDVGKYFFDGNHFKTNKIKLYGAIPQVYDYKDVPIDELYVF
jgi:hypothetical protein